MEVARHNTMEIDQLWFAKQTFIYVCMWSALYLVIHYLVSFKECKKTQSLLHDKLVSTFHGTVTFCNATYFAYYKGLDFEVSMDFFSAHIIAFSLGYFIYDLIQNYIMGLSDHKLVLHHVLSILTFGSVGLSQKGVFLGVIGLSMAESSNFSMHMRGICKLLKMQHTKILELFEMMYFLTYIFFRGIISPFFIVLAAYSPSTPLYCQLTILGLWIQSLFFMKAMFSIMAKKWPRYLERKEKGIPMYWFSKNPDVNKLTYVNKKKTDTLF